MAGSWFSTRMRWALVVAALAGGCGYEAAAGDGLGAPVPMAVEPASAAEIPPAQPEVKPGQEEALRVVEAAFGTPIGPVALEWVEQTTPGCPDGSFEAYGECRAGIQDVVDGVMRVRVFWKPGATFSGTTFAHELCHVAFGDVEHARECGTVRPITKTRPAEDALRAAGL